jgi:hypothetical protein
MSKKHVHNMVLSIRLTLMCKSIVNNAGRRSKSNNLNRDCEPRLDLPEFLPHFLLSFFFFYIIPQNDTVMLLNFFLLGQLEGFTGCM